MMVTVLAVDVNKSSVADVKVRVDALVNSSVVVADSDVATMDDSDTTPVGVMLMRVFPAPSCSSNDPSVTPAPGRITTSPPVVVPAPPVTETAPPVEDAPVAVPPTTLTTPPVPVFTLLVPP